MSGKVLRGLGAAILWIAGCSGDDNATSATEGESSTTGEMSATDGTTTTSTTDTSTTTSASTTGTSTTTTTTTGETSGTTTTSTTTTTTGETDTTATTEPVTTTDGTTTGGECGPGEPGPDADGDTVPDACDVCPDGDDLADGDDDGIPDGCDQCLDGPDDVDGDGDGVADACDPCPVDNPDDPDDDGICTVDDVCLEGDDNVDIDDDGIPDACDPEVKAELKVPHNDYDVAGDGALVLVRDQFPNLYLTCYNGDLTVRRPEFLVSTYTSNANRAWPEVHIARAAQKVLVTWLEGGNGQPNSEIRYSLFDDKCQPIVEKKTGLSIPNGYGEMHDAAITAAGEAVISVSPSQTEIVHLAADGTIKKAQSTAFNIGAVYGTHVAVNQADGGGVVAAQIHSGNGIYFRRFAADGSWKDPDKLQVSIDYHYWYDGFTVGMNDKSQMAFLWRPGGTTFKARIYDANLTVLTDLVRNTIDFEGWNGGHCYDSFRMRHQEIPLRGDNFVLGEVYNWITPQQNRIVHHYEFTPSGTEIAVDQTMINLEEGLTIRTNDKGTVYLSDHQQVAVVGDYL
ncbi:MAG: hypothetical protein R3B09_35550 [Nannocystaceae bacterium]